MPIQNAHTANTTQHLGVEEVETAAKLVEEEKQKLELAASDTRIARTQAMGRYDKCRQHMEHELVWFHEELARTMGAALKDLVVAQGASAGQAAHACAGHFEELRAMLRSAPAALV